MNGLASFEKDYGERFYLKVSRTQLDEGRGIVKTIQADNAKYHKVYKTYCSNSRLNSFTDKNDSADPKLKKKSSVLQYLLYRSILVAYDVMDRTERIYLKSKKIMYTQT